jgi:predicted nuclease with TOPRIM domain
MMSDSRHVATYPVEEQYQRWEDRAEMLGMSVSEFVEAMVEAGLKKFETTVEPDMTNQELRDQRDELKQELDHSRTRIQQLEDAAYHGERRTIKRFVEQNPGADYDEIMQHVIDTVPQRVTTQLDELEGAEIQNTDTGYYPVQLEESS